MSRIGELISKGALSPLITETIPMSGAVEAIERIANRGVVGKVVFIND